MLHVETDLGVINITVGLTDRFGRRVVSIETLANRYAGEPEVVLDGRVNTRLIESTVHLA